MGSDRRRELEEAQAELDGLRAELHDSRRQVDEMAHRIGELEAGSPVRTATDDPADASALARRVAELESRLVAAGRDPGDDPDPATLGSQIAALQEVVQAAAERETSLLERVHRSDTVVADAGQRLAELAREIELAADRTAEVERELADERLARERAENEFTSVSARENQVNEALAIAELERDGARGELDRQLREIEELASQLAERDAAIVRSTHDLDVAETARIAADERLRDREERVAELEAESHELQEMHERLVAELEREREALRGSGSANAALEANLAAAQSEAETVRSELRRLDEELIGSTEAREQLASQRADERTRIQETELDLENTRAELKGMSAAVAEAKEDLANAVEEMAAAKETEGEMRARIGTAEAEAESAREAAAAAETTAAAAAERLAEGEARVAAAEATAAEAEGQVAAAEERAIESERLLVEFDGRLQQSQTLLEEARQRADAATQETGADDADLEARLAEALASAKEAHDLAGAAQADLTRAEEVLESLRDREAEQRTRAEGLLAELDGAHDRLKALEEAGEDGATAPASPSERDPSSTLINDLEQRLESAETRSRRAYAAAESAEAALRFAKERGGSVPSDPFHEEENVRLRVRIAELTDRLADLERDDSAAQAAATMGERSARN
jgi:chromosome segregation ATPase